MTLIDTIRKRYSCRAYHQKPVEQEKLDQLFEAARLAPSAKNTQDWRFVVVTDIRIKHQLAQTTNRPDLFEKAGVIITACSNSDYIMRCGQPIAPIDIAIALEHIALQAAEMGLGTCWIGSFETKKVRTILGIPDDIQIIELMTVGYPADTPRQHNRETVEKIVCYDKWKF
jgi:nitroreductase